MTSCRRTPYNSLLLLLSSDSVSSAHSDTGKIGLRFDSANEAPRPSALRSLLFFTGSTQAHDSLLSRTTEAELSLMRETLELLNRIESANAA
ncbi:MAG: hypothetical protein MI924_01300 [Chloroflexales bacterium]|nr:hypothetical protein [Chloroflexales bacterium]